MDVIFTSCGIIKSCQGAIFRAVGGNIFSVVLSSVILYFQTQSNPSITEYEGDLRIFAFKEEFGYIISCVIFLSILLPIPFLYIIIYKLVAGRSANDLARSTGDAGDNIVARTSDGSEKSDTVAAVCSRFQIGSSWPARLIIWYIFSKWKETFELNVLELGTIGQETDYVSWEYLARPMKQQPKRTCAIVACIVAVEAINRYKYAMLPGEDTPFPWVAAAEPRELVQECQLAGIWNKDNGAYVYRVLEFIQNKGGVPLANPPFNTWTELPLSSWQPHTGVELTEKLVFQLVSDGPCVGTLWVCPWYHLFDARHHNTLVYRGCGRNPENRNKSVQVYGKKVGSHAVVLLGIRCCGDQVHVLILDNHRTNGPLRWVDAREIDGIYTLSVEYCGKKMVR